MRVGSHILIAFGVLIPTLALAQSDPSILAQRASQQLDAAERSLRDAEGARDRVSALTETIRAYEEGLSALRKSVRQAAIRETAVRRRMDADRDRLSALLATLQAMRSTPETLLLHPDGPAATARAGMILTDLSPVMQAEIAHLQADLEDIHLLRSLRAEAAQSLQEGLAHVQQARMELSQAIANREDLPRRYVEDQVAMQTLLDSSETLRAFVTGLADVPRASSGRDTTGFEEARGRLRLPVTGTVLRKFEEADAAGVTRPGLIIAARPQALVSSPWDATIRYRGPLLNYGNVVILEPDRNALIVLSGLGQVFGETGEIVAKGAPLGLMPPNPDENDAELSADVSIDAGADWSETLYMELRLNQEPVDPAPWFAAEKE